MTLVSSLLATNSVALAEESPWSMYRHDGQGTAKSPFSGPEEPGHKWDFWAGYFAYFPPAIAGDGTIYLSANNRLFALKSDGTEKWNSSIYIDNLAPAIGEDGAVYVRGGPDFGDIYSISPADGDEVWNVSIGRSNAPPKTGDDGTVYSTGGGKLYAMSPGGRIKWENGDHNFIGHLAISADGSTIYADTGGWRLLAVRAADGGEVWGAGEFRNVPHNPAVGPDGTIYAAKGFDYHHLVALDPRDDREEWAVDIEGDGGLPAIDHSRHAIYVISTGNALYSVTKEGPLKWRAELSGWNNDAPTIGGDGTVYVTSDGVLYAFDPETGDEKWLITGGGDTFRGLSSSPSIGEDGTLYVGHDRGLYALGEEIATGFGDSSYLFVHRPMTWNEADQYARSLGGHLVTISDSEENQFVDKLAATCGRVGPFWIGLSDQSGGGDFRWVTGEPLAFTSWSPVPDGLTDEDYAVYNTYCCNSWSAVNESEPRQFVVEFEGAAAALQPPESCAGGSLKIEPWGMASSATMNPNIAGPVLVPGWYNFWFREIPNDWHVEGPEEISEGIVYVFDFQTAGMEGLDIMAPPGGVKPPEGEAYLWFGRNIEHEYEICVDGPYDNEGGGRKLTRQIADKVSLLPKRWRGPTSP